MARILCSTLLVILAGVAAPIASASPHSADPQWPRSIGWKGCPAPEWEKQPSAEGLAQGARVLLIGDSLTRASRGATIHRLKKDGWTPTVRCWGGKRLDWGISQIKRAKHLDQLPQTVVIALGTNDMRLIQRPVTSARVNALLDAIGPDRQVLWVTTHFEGGMSQAGDRERWFNQLLREQAQSRPNLRLIEWAKLAREQGLHTRDGIHYGREGSLARADAIRDGLAQLVSAAPVSATRAEILQSD